MNHTIRDIVRRVILNDIYDDDDSYNDIAKDVACEVATLLSNLGRQCRLKHSTDGHAGRVGVTCNVFQSGAVQVFFDQFNMVYARIEDVEWADEVSDRPVAEAGEKENA